MTHKYQLGDRVAYQPFWNGVRTLDHVYVTLRPYANQIGVVVQRLNAASPGTNPCYTVRFDDGVSHWFGEPVLRPPDSPNPYDPT